MPGPFTTYFDQESLPLPFCPGCGHTVILEQLDAALVQLQLDPQKMVIVTDIGCSGLSDRYFQTNTFHGLHGRSLTYATGIKLMNPDLTVIVIIGDGGCGIGGQHLLNAARRNVGLKVLVFNNFNYGMTGGEHSVTTPPGMTTITTPGGQLEQPLDICATVSVNGASHVRRTTTFDRQLKDHLVGAISSEGFALVDIWELCTSYFASRNKFSRQKILQTLEELEFPTGMIIERSRPEYSRALRHTATDLQGKQLKRPDQYPTRYSHQLANRQEIILAGDAGMKIGSAARIFCTASLLAGLHTSHRHDYPVTVQSGFSISEIVLSPDPIAHPAVGIPSHVVALFPAGLKKVLPIIHSLTPGSTLYLDSSLPEVKTNAEVIRMDFSTTGKPLRRKEHRALAALGAVLKREKFFDLQALLEAASLREDFAQQNLEAIEAGMKMKIG